MANIFGSNVIKNATNNVLKKRQNSSGSSNSTGRDPYEERYGSSGSGTGAITSTRGSSSSGGSSNTNTVDQSEQWKAYLAALEAQKRELEQQRIRAANEAYERNVAAMNSAFDQRGQILKGNLDSTLQNLATDYNASRSEINTDATNAAREAYINRMMSQRNLAQNMAAQGLSGGASETTMAGLENNYGNARNAIATTANENLGKLENLYSQNRNSAQQAYNEQLAADELQRAQYLTQFESDRQNALAQAYDEQISRLMDVDPTYFAAMSAATNNQAAYTPTEQTEPGNTPASVSTTQGSSSGLTARAPRYALRLAQQMAANGQSANSIIQTLANNSVSSDSIAAILSQLGYSM